MVKERTPEAGWAPRGPQLFEFSVVLVASNNNPSIINPDFLLHNGIVTDRDPIRKESISTPTFSVVKFQGDVNVRAEPNRVVFEQTGSSIAIDSVICAEIAKRYLKTIPHVPYSALGLNPKSFEKLPVQRRSGIEAAIAEQGAWMKHDSVVPEFGLKATYLFRDRRITFDVQKAQTIIDNSSISAVVFQANIHREIKEHSQPMRINSMLSILDSWMDDYSDFTEISSKLRQYVY